MPVDRTTMNVWEDTLRFSALRLHEAGMIKSSPAEDHCPGHRVALPQ
jgi:hypothetical protein